MNLLMRSHARFLSPGQKALMNILLAALMVLATGCKIEILAGPTEVTIGDTVTYTLELSEGSTDSTLWLVADVPPGWRFVSAFFEGESSGTPVSGFGEQSPSGGPCGDDDPLGGRRVRIVAQPISLSSGDTGTAEVTFEILDQPTDPYQIRFSFGGSTTGFGGECSPPAVRTINPEGNALMTFAQVVFNDDPGIELMGSPDAVIVTDDGRHVIVASREDNALNVFTRQADTGLLAFQGAYGHTDPGDGLLTLSDPLDVIVTQDGRHCYAASPGSSAIVAFERDPATGTLTFIGAYQNQTNGISALEGVNNLAISADDAYLYATASLDNAVVVFERDTNTGALNLVEELIHGQGDVGILESAGQVIASRDNQHIYIRAVESDFFRQSAITVFERDPANGRLTLVDVTLGSSLPESGFLFDFELIRSGAQIYATRDDAVMRFDRDAATGILTFVDSRPNRLGILATGGIALGDRGRNIYTAGRDFVFGYERFPNSGSFFFSSLHFETDGQPPNQGLENPQNMAISPDGDHLYVTSNSDRDSVAVYLLDAVLTDDFESGDTARWSKTVP